MRKTRTRGLAPLRRLLAALAVAIGVIASGGAASAAGSEGSPTLMFVTPASVVSGQPVVASATLFDMTVFAPTAGQLVVFSAPTVPDCFAITDGSGIASCALPVSGLPAGTYPLTAAYAGNGVLAAAFASAPLQVSAAQASVAISGPAGAITAGSPVTLSAVLERLSAPAGPLGGEVVQLGLGAQACSALTDGAGSASCTIPAVVHPAGPAVVSAQFGDGTFYSPVSAFAAVTVEAPPSPVAFSVTPPAIATVQTASFAWSATVSLSRFECALDGAAFAACSSPRTYNGLAAGPHELCVRITTDPAAACWSWTIVSPGAPDTVFTLTPPPVTASRTAAFAWTSDQPAPRYQCSLDGAAFAPCSSPRTYKGLALGSHVLRVRAINFAGDVDPTPAAWGWTITP